MPTFRTTPSGNLTNSIRQLIASGGSKLGPMQEMQADMAAANTAQHLSLAEKARAEVEAMRSAEARRSDPTLRTEYAANAAGVDMPDANRLVGAIRGQMEQPGPSDVDDAAAVGREAQPYPMARPNLEPGKERVFRSALAATIGNLIATGKTNAEQLADAGSKIDKTALTNDAVNADSVPDANRIIAAVHGKIREPFKLGTHGEVLNEESGELNEGTALAQAAARLSGARATTEVARSATEGARQGELSSRSGFNTARTTTEASRQSELAARAGLATARAGAVTRGETGRGGQRVTPQQVERWVSEVARKEWDTIPPRERKGMNYDQHLEKVRQRFKGDAANGGVEQDTKDALAAIGGGAPAKAVRDRFKKRWGIELIDAAPDPTDDGLGASADALDKD
jgi:hypothetical protein